MISVLWITPKFVLKKLILTDNYCNTFIVGFYFSCIFKRFVAAFIMIYYDILIVFMQLAGILWFWKYFGNLIVCIKSHVWLIFSDHFMYLSSEHMIEYTNKWISVNYQHFMIQIMLQCKSIALGANSFLKISFWFIHIILDISPEGILLLMMIDFCLLWNSNTKLSA